MWSIPPNEVVEMMRILFIFILFYVLTTPLVKISILLFYRRIFGMTYPIWFCMFLSVGYFFSGWITFLSYCRPVSYYWTQFAEPSGGKCVFNIYPFFITQAAVNMVTDVLILVVPIPILWNLQMKRAQKILLSGIFLVGGMCVTPRPSVFDSSSYIPVSALQALYGFITLPSSKTPTIIPLS